MDDSTTCSICLESPPEEVEQAIIPTCSHQFCVSCVLSWSVMRCECPLCKRDFGTLLVRRTMEGEPVHFGDGELGWTEISVPQLQAASWTNLYEVSADKPDDAGWPTDPAELHELYAYSSSRQEMSQASRPRSTALYEDEIAEAVRLELTDCYLSDDDLDMSRYNYVDRHSRRGSRRGGARRGSRTEVHRRGSRQWRD